MTSSREQVFCVAGARIVADMKKFKEDLFAVLKCSSTQILCLHLGSNDMMISTPTSVVRNYRMLLEEVLEDHAHLRILVSAVPLRSWNRYKPNVWNEEMLPALVEAINSTNADLGEMCSRLERCCFVPHFSLSSTSLGRDGLHFNFRGACQLLEDFREFTNVGLFLPNDYNNRDFHLDLEIWPELQTTLPVPVDSDANPRQESYVSVAGRHFTEMLVPTKAAKMPSELGCRTPRAIRGRAIPIKSLRYTSNTENQTPFEWKTERRKLQPKLLNDSQDWCAMNRYECLQQDVFYTEKRTLPIQKKEQRTSPTQKKQRTPPTQKKEKRTLATQKKEQRTPPTQQEQRTTPTKKKEQRTLPTQMEQVPTQKKEQRTPSTQKEQRTPPTQKKEQRTAPTQKKEQRTLPIQKKEQRTPPTQKKEQRTAPTQKKEQRTLPIQKKEQRTPPTQKKELRALPTQKKEQRTLPTQKEQVPTQKKEQRTPSTQKEQRTPPTQKKEQRTAPTQKKEQRTPQTQMEQRTLQTQKKEQELPTQKKEQRTPPTQKKRQRTPPAQKEQRTTPTQKKEQRTPPTQKEQRAPPTQKKEQRTQTTWKKKQRRALKKLKHSPRRSPEFIASLTSIVNLIEFAKTSLDDKQGQRMTPQQKIIDEWHRKDSIKENFSEKTDVNAPDASTVRCTYGRQAGNVDREYASARESYHIQYYQDIMFGGGKNGDGKCGRPRGKEGYGRRKVDYDAISRRLQVFCSEQNQRDISADGPYGLACLELNMSNNKKNRKYLHCIWIRNYGNIKQNEKKFEAPANTKKAECETQIQQTKAEDENITIFQESKSKQLGETQKVTKEKTPVSQTRTHYKDTKKQTAKKDCITIQKKDMSRNENKKRQALKRASTSTEDTSYQYVRKSKRIQANPKLQSLSTYTKKVPVSDRYCICRCKNWDSKEGGGILCEGCDRWYHYVCLNLKPEEVPDGTIPDECITFMCGKSGCNKGKLVISYESFSDTQTSHSGTLLDSSRQPEQEMDSLKTNEKISASVVQNTSIQDKNGKEQETPMEISDECITNQIKNENCSDTNMRDQAKTAENVSEVNETTELGVEETTSIMQTEESEKNRLSHLMESVKVIQNELETFIKSSNKSKKELDVIEARLDNLLDDCDAIQCIHSEKKQEKKETIKKILSILREIEKIQCFSSSEHSSSIPQVTEPETDEIDNDNLGLDNLGLNSEYPDNQPELEQYPFMEEVSQMATCNASLNTSSDVEDVEDLIDDDDDDDNLHCTMEKETIEKILQQPIPENFFTFKLPKAAEFSISDSDWETLMAKKDKDKKVFQSGSWQKPFVDGLKSSNKFCVFKFKRHRVNKGTYRGKNIFTANGECMLSNCPVKFSLNMKNYNQVTVNYSGDVRHKISEVRSRPIRRTERQELYKEFESGKKPLKHYNEKLITKDRESLVAGNLDDVGTLPVLRQISSESVKQARLDQECFTSLLLQKQELKKKDGYGFIQKISISPQVVYFWTEEGVRLFHDLAEKNVLFWDATGSLVRTVQGRKFLYYELAVRNPLKGKQAITLASMITEDQSQPIILDWIRSFRYAEKIIYGHSNMRQPALIINDQAFVFMLAALLEFNNEDLNSFYKRSWNIVHGKATIQDTKKTTLHLCASHFMGTVKKFMRKHYAKHQVMGMYMISLLMNCSTIEEAEEVLYDVCVTLACQHLDARSRTYIQRLISKINKFETTAEGEVLKKNKESESPGYSESDNITSLSKNRFTEKEYLELGSMSPFKSWGEKIKICAIRDLQKSSTQSNENNTYQSEKVLKKIFEKWIPLFPLWSNLLLGDLSRFNKEYFFGSFLNSGKNVLKTQSAIENRFNVLKNIQLNPTKQYRLDDFSIQLYTDVKASQLNAAITYLKRKPKKLKKATEAIKEEWNKRKQQTNNLKRQVGVFQRAPSTPLANSSIERNNVKDSLHSKIPATSKTTKVKMEDTKAFKEERQPSWSARLPTIHGRNMKRRKTRMATMREQPPVQETNMSHLKNNDDTSAFFSMFCGMKNFGTTCWFNSSMQSLCCSKMSEAILRLNTDSVINVDDQCLKTSFSVKIQNILQHMKEKKGVPVPESLVKSSLDTVKFLNPNMFNSSSQQDVDEFFTTFLCPLIQKEMGIIEFEESKICQGCKSTQTCTVNNGQVLRLNLPQHQNQVEHLDLLVKDLLTRKDNIPCTECGGQQQKTLQLKQLPQTILIQLIRYHDNNRKISTAVVPSVKMSFSQYLPDKSVKKDYELKSIICHKNGVSIHSGHYTTVVYCKEHFVELDDDRNPANYCQESMLQDSYYLLYDVLSVEQGYVIPLLDCLSFSLGLRRVNIGEERNMYVANRRTTCKDYCRMIISRDYSSPLYTNMITDIKGHPLHNEKMHPRFFIEVLMHFIFRKQSVDYTVHETEAFRTESRYVSNCKCGRFYVKRKSCCVASVKSLNDREELRSQLYAYHPSGDICVDCGQHVQCDKYITHLPDTLVLASECTKIPLRDCSVLKLAEIVDKAFYYDASDYEFSSGLCFEDGEYFCVKKEDKHFENLSSGQLVNADCTPIILLFNKKRQQSEIPLKKVNISENLPKLKFHQKAIAQKEINSYKDAVSMERICAKESWFSSRDIEDYMKVLADNCKGKRVHIVSADWFSKRLLVNNQTANVRGIFTLENRKHPWSGFDFILVPVNELHTHWSVLILDMNKKICYYCDSLQQYKEELVFQILKYINFDSICNHGQKVNVRDWSICDYCVSENYPSQEDGSSCGPYVCQNAKAILFRRTLSQAIDLPSKMRKTIARELLDKRVIDL